MTRLAAFFRLSFLCILGLLPQLASADSWAAPKTTVTLSSDGGYRVTIEPKSWGAPAGRNEAPERALARVERLDAGKWRLVWQKHLLNELAPTSALLADKAAYLVTFDNGATRAWAPTLWSFTTATASSCGTCRSSRSCRRATCATCRAA
jgi:hypothetical protein